MAANSSRGCILLHSLLVGEGNCDFLLLFFKIREKKKQSKTFLESSSKLPTQIGFTCLLPNQWWAREIGLSLGQLSLSLQLRSVSQTIVPTTLTATGSRKETAWRVLFTVVILIICILNSCKFCYLLCQKILMNSKDNSAFHFIQWIYAPKWTWDGKHISLSSSGLPSPGCPSYWAWWLCWMLLVFYLELSKRQSDPFHCGRLDWCCGTYWEMVFLYFTSDLRDFYDDFIDRWLLHYLLTLKLNSCH